MNSAAFKPFARKTFYLDLKGFPLELKLAKDLKLLGGKQETFLSKDVSFVVSNRISTKLNSVSSVNSWTGAPVSPHLFNESPWDCMDSPTNVSTSNLEANFAPVSRGMSLVQKARQKAGMNHQSVKHGTADILENCKLWNIKVYDVKKLLLWVQKYKNLYYKKYATELKEQQKKLKANNEDVKKLQTPYIKIEDCKRQYQSRYKEVKYSADMLNILAKVKEINYQYCKGNKLCKKPPRFVLKEINNKSVQFTQPKPLQSLSVSASVTSLCPPASNCIYASNKNYNGKLNPALKRKGKDCKKKSKKMFCEICEVYFSDLNEHLVTKQHEAFMKNVTHYKAITEIISKFANVSQLSCFRKNMDFNSFRAQIKEKPLLNIEHSNHKLDLSFLKAKEQPFICKENKLSIQDLDREKSVEQLATCQSSNIKGFTEHFTVYDSSGKMPAMEGFCEQKTCKVFNDVDLLCKETLNFTESESLSFPNFNEQSHLMNPPINVATKISNISTTFIAENSCAVVRESLLKNANFYDPIVPSVEGFSANEPKRKTCDAFVCFKSSVLNEGYNSFGCKTLVNSDDTQAAFNKNSIGIEMQMPNDAKLVSVNAKQEKYEYEFEDMKHAQKSISGVSVPSGTKEIVGNKFEAIGNCTEYVEDPDSNCLVSVLSHNIQTLFCQNDHHALIQTSDSMDVQKKSSNTVAVTDREPDITFQNNTDGNNVVKFANSNVEIEMNGPILSNQQNQFLPEDINQFSNTILLTEKDVNNGEDASQLKGNFSNNTSFPLPVLVDDMAVENNVFENETLTMPLLEVEIGENRAKYDNFDMPKLQVCCELKNGKANSITEVANDDKSDCGTELYNVEDDIVSASCSSDDDRLLYLEDTSGLLEVCDIHDGTSNKKKSKVSSEKKSKYNFKTLTLERNNINSNMLFGSGHKSLYHEDQNINSVRAAEECNGYSVQSAVPFKSNFIDENTENFLLKKVERIEHSSKDVKLVEKNNVDENDLLDVCLPSKQQNVSSLQPLNLARSIEANDGILNQNIADFPNQVYTTSCPKEFDSSNNFKNYSVSNLHKSSSLVEEGLFQFDLNKVDETESKKVSTDSGMNKSSMNKKRTISSFKEIVDSNRNFENYSEDSNLSEEKLFNSENQKLYEGCNSILQTDKLPDECSSPEAQTIFPVESPKDIGLNRSILNQNPIHQSSQSQSNEHYLIHETESNSHKNALPLPDDSCYLSASDGCLNLSKNLDSSKCMQTCSLSLSVPFCSKNNDSCSIIMADFESDLEEDEEWLEIHSDVDSACKSLSETDTFAVDLSTSRCEVK